MMITYEQLVEWRVCYLQDDRAGLLRRLFSEPVTLRDVLTRQDGEWAKIPAEDRIWVATRPGVLGDRVLRLIACDIAERALLAEREAGREPDARSWAAIEVSRRHAIGEATAGELAAARAAAGAAAGEAAWDAAREAAWEAAWAAAGAAAREATRAAGAAARAAAREATRAARDAARDAAWDSAWDSAWEANVAAFLGQIEAANAAEGE